MKLKKIIMLASVITLLGTASVLAADAYENYRAKSVEVYVNETKVRSDGLLVDMNGNGRTMLPLRDVAANLGAFVEWDSRTQTAHLYKPNVDLILVTEEKDAYGLFQMVNYNEPAPPFMVIAQIDGMKKEFYSYRFSIHDPNGKVIYENEKLNESNDEVIWKRTPLIELTFDQKGTYVVKLDMKLKEADDYLTVAEKGFLSQ